MIGCPPTSPSLHERVAVHLPERSRLGLLTSTNDHVAVADSGTLEANVHDDVRRNAGDEGTFEDTNTFSINPSATGSVGANVNEGEFLALTTTLDGANDVEAHRTHNNQDGVHGDTVERGQIEDLSMLERVSMPMATAERIQGEADEENRMREKAVEVRKAEYTAERAANCREDVAEMFRTRVPLHPDAKQEIMEESRNKTPVWDDFTQDEVAEINQYAASVNDKLPEAVLNRAKVAELLAHKYADSKQGIHEDALKVMKKVKGANDVEQELHEVDMFAQDSATVVVDVKTLFYPNNDKQQQVGWLTNYERDAKFAIWKKSGKKTILSIGAKVRLTNAKVQPKKHDERGWYMTLAVTSDTEIEVIEEGAGRAPHDREYPSTNRSKLRTPNTQESHMGQIHENRKIKSEVDGSAGFVPPKEAPEATGIYGDLRKAVRDGECVVEDCDKEFHSVARLIEHVGTKAKTCKAHEEVNADLLFDTWDRSAKAKEVFGAQMRTPQCPVDGCNHEIETLQDLISHAGGKVSGGDEAHQDIMAELEEEA